MGDQRRAPHIKENQQQPILRSMRKATRSYIRFINKTMRNVVLYWIDYEGQAVSYGVLSPGDYRDINTFNLHPWIFVDKETGDRYMVNQRDVFLAPPWFTLMRCGRLPHRLPRWDVYITLPVYTLRELCLRAIQKCLTYDRDAFLLDIPRSLQHELAAMLPKYEEDKDDQSSQQ